VIDMVVASVLLSMGMMMLPPVMISMPFKVLFVCARGRLGAIDRLADTGIPMTIELLNQVSRQTFETVLLVGGPVLLVSLIVGVLISIFQAITQLQEVTLTFVPKIVAIFITLLLTLPWTVKVLVGFTRGLL